MSFKFEVLVFDHGVVVVVLDPGYHRGLENLLNLGHPHLRNNHCSGLLSNLVPHIRGPFVEGSDHSGPVMFRKPL